MTLGYLLDTNICIYIIKNRPPTVRDRFARLQPGQLGLSAVTEAELLHGGHISQRVNHNLAAISDFVSRLVVVPFDSRVTDTYGHVRAILEQQGQPIGPLDFQIVATALAHDLVLVTNNVREFQRVPALRVEDWSQA
ncbi:tRNA(fMet)-specific endonuclease VapC [Deinococcus malanensis]|uniref:Ribonuclease VapC n=1 Tax=Deinococcus malanensis TaxID=1706855 RepID=A0ABQ2F4R7_9DEIO|nr:type II toxin-antitoxin system VapC family toxin [Deinococcus malanensis]GGK42202.1 tRNA(fMet)-specific endonuclease VapC [Deinococcus malanensis]